MTIHELNHVAIYVTDVQRSSDFYERVLKLQPIPRPGYSVPGACFLLGTTQALHLIANLRSPLFPSHDDNHFAMRVDDLDPWERHLKEVGVNVARRKPRPDGASQVYLRDPDGHMIELLT